MASKKKTNWKKLYEQREERIKQFEEREADFNKKYLAYESMFRTLKEELKTEILEEVEEKISEEVDVAVNDLSVSR